ncbi:MAG: L-threonylcarbamoyladenylate synthase [Candidatus Bipolaricaulota bacterium]|nr:L-threonylcarbamoyladenylate synthase [Candidatus Bipolaricaulota bacterium]
MRAKIISGDDPSLAGSLSSLLDKGGVLIFPTDTVFGLGGDPYSGRAVRMVRTIKCRPMGQPFSLHLSNIGAVERFARLDQRTRLDLSRFLPGPYTFILPATAAAPPAVVQSGKVGVRVPDHPFFNRLPAGVGRPLFGTSVNRSGEPPALTLDEVIEHFAGKVDLIVTGKAGTGRPSSVIDLTLTPPRALRGKLPMGLR